MPGRKRSDTVRFRDQHPLDGHRCAIKTVPTVDLTSGSPSEEVLDFALAVADPKLARHRKADARLAALVVSVLLSIGLLLLPFEVWGGNGSRRRGSLNL